MKKRRRQDGRLHRLFRRLGRPRLQRADEGRPRRTGIKVVTNERYARPDTSVTRPGAQDHRRASRRGDDRRLGHARRAALSRARRARLQGPLYGTPRPHQPRLRARRRRVGEGADRSTGPVIVADQLPRHPIRKKVRGLPRRSTRKSTARRAPTPSRPTRSTPGWSSPTPPRAPGARREPGTPAFREALHDAIISTKEVVGTHGVYNFKPGEPLRRRRARPRGGAARTGKWKCAEP